MITVHPLLLVGSLVLAGVATATTHLAGPGIIILRGEIFTAPMEVKAERGRILIDGYQYYPVAPAAPIPADKGEKAEALLHRILGRYHEEYWERQQKSGEGEAFATVLSKMRKNPTVEIESVDSTRMQITARLDQSTEASTEHFRLPPPSYYAHYSKMTRFYAREYQRLRKTISRLEAMDKISALMDKDPWILWHRMLPPTVGAYEWHLKGMGFSDAGLRNTERVRLFFPKDEDHPKVPPAKHKSRRLAYLHDLSRLLDSLHNGDVVIQTSDGKSHFVKASPEILLRLSDLQKKRDKHEIQEILEALPLEKDVRATVVAEILKARQSIE